MDWILLIAGLLMALIAGVFLSFSDFVMRGLVQAPAGAGAAGMIGLNRTVYRSVFMILLMGFVPASIALTILAVWQLEGVAMVFVLGGSGAYLFGVLAVTGLGNVPMNKRLDALSEEGTGMIAYWAQYAGRWTRLNHVRTASSAVTALSWLMAANMI